MKSDEVSLWQIVWHFLGFHIWGPKQYWAPPEIDLDTCLVTEAGIYQVCEICGEEEILQTPY